MSFTVCNGKLDLRVKALAPQHPEWKETEPFKSVLAGDLKGLAAGGEHALLELVLATHTGKTTEEFEQVVRDWIATGESPVAILASTVYIRTPSPQY